MANLKVIIFQKNINSDLTKDQKLKISAAKADFLILPRFFPYFETPREGIELKESYFSINSKNHSDCVFEKNSTLTLF
jgi:hypothetical protein